MSTFTNANANATSKRSPLTMEERKAKAVRAEAWNGKQKHGSYARHRQVIATAAADRTAFKVAEGAGEFVTVRRGKKSKKTNTVEPTLPKTISRFAALADDEETESLPVITTPPNRRTEPTPVTPKLVSWGPVNKSATVTPTKAPDAQMKKFGLKNGSWADECDSDDEE